MEPFGGAASILIRKQRSYSEVYNDLDGDVVNLFQVLRSDRADDLVELLTLTPFAEAEFAAAYQPAEDGVERARRLVVRSMMGFGSNGHNRVTGFRFNSNRTGTTPAMDWTNYPAALRAIIERMRGVTVMNRDALAVMTAHDTPETLHYVDPPYVSETRDCGKDYAHEMTAADHSRLLCLLQELQGQVILSGYAHPSYDNALQNWHRTERQTHADGARERVEVLWMNFDPRSAPPPGGLFGSST